MIHHGDTEKILILNCQMAIRMTVTGSAVGWYR